MTNEEIIQALTEPYPAWELEVKTKPFTAIYVDARTPVARLNKVLPGCWSFRLVGPPRGDDKGNIARDGVLILDFNGVEREFYATGSESPDFDKGDPKAEKGADSDTFKRCCFKAGIGAYIYELPKTLQGNTLTAAQVELAARLAGYTGAIKPEHFGAMDKNRVLKSSSVQSKDEPKLPASSYASTDQIQQIRDAVAAGGGNSEAASFLGWLAKNTANQTKRLDHVLSEDVEEIVAMLDRAAEERKARGAAS